MMSVSLAIVLASALAAGPSTEELIGYLGSPDRAVREEASRTLEELGTEALPALRVARGAADTVEARARFTDLIGRIEARQLDRPTLVALDFDDRPLGEAVRSLTSRGGHPLMLDDPALAERRVTARGPAPLPFWEAVDLVARAGHVRHDPGPRYYGPGYDPRMSAILLVDGGPPAFTTYSGPLRIHLFATHRHRDVSFEAAALPQAKATRATVTVEVQAFAEPGRFIDPYGLPRIETVDNEGRVFPSNQAVGERPDPAQNSWAIEERLSILHWHIPLGLPDGPVKSPLKLRGVLPVVISSRAPGPLVIPLSGAAGKTFRQGRNVVRVETVSRGNGQNVVTLVLSEDGGESRRGRDALGPQADHLSDFVQHRLDFEDDAGRPLRWTLAGQPQPNTNGELRAQIYVGAPVAPARLLVYRLLRLASEVPFEFVDVPSP